MDGDLAYVPAQRIPFEGQPAEKPFHKVPKTISYRVIVDSETGEIIAATADHTITPGEKTLGQRLLQDLLFYPCAQESFITGTIHFHVWDLSLLEIKTP